MDTNRPTPITDEDRYKFSTVMTPAEVAQRQANARAAALTTTLHDIVETAMGGMVGIVPTDEG